MEKENKVTSGLPAFTWKMGVKLKLCVNGLICAMKKLVGYSLVHCYLTSAMGIVFGGVCVFVCWQDYR